MRSCLILTVGLASLHPATIYSEATSGDLSNSGLSPTALSVAPGSNQIFGATGRGSTGIDLDYFTITVPSGLALAGLIVLPGTQSGGAFSFIGMQAGPQFTAI